MDWDPTNHAVITRHGNSQRTNSKTVVRPSPSQLHLRPAKWQTQETEPPISVYQPRSWRGDHGSKGWNPKPQWRSLVGRPPGKISNHINDVYIRHGIIQGSLSYAEEEAVRMVDAVVYEHSTLDLGTLCQDLRMDLFVYFISIN